MTQPMSEPDTPARACPDCGTTIPERYTFRRCNVCALKALSASPEVRAWREEQRRKAYERIATMKANQARED
jgi:hypothetical protein